MRPIRSYLPEHASAGKVPARAAVGNLVWTHGGAVWGVWRVEPVTFRYLSHAEKLGFHENVRGLLLALPSESLVLSVCPPVNRQDAALATLKGAERETVWQSEAEEALRMIDGWESAERRFYVAGRIGAGTGWRAQIREQAAGVIRRPFTVPTDRDIRMAFARAAKIEEGLRRGLRVEHPGPNEIRWLYARALRRGIRDLDITPGSATEIQAPGFAAIGDIETVEGGDRRDVGRGMLSRYLRVAEPHPTADAVGYQVHIALSEMPGEYLFPHEGSQILSAADRFGFPVDWCVKMHKVSNAESVRRLTKKMKQLMGELGGDGQARRIEQTGQIPVELKGAFAAAEFHRERLGALKSEGNVRMTAAFTVWDSDRAEAEAKAEALVDALVPHEWMLHRATGGQAGLLELGMPGGREAPVVWNYAQTVLPTDIAGLGPFTCSAVGDDRGMLLGAQMDCGTPRPVWWDPEEPLNHGGSASVAFCGTLGSGKSYGAKLGAKAVVFRGGVIAAVDRTAEGEWVRFAEAIRSAGFSTSVITTDPDSHGSFDPWRIFADVKDQKARAIGLCLLVTQAPTNSLQAICVTDAAEEIAKLPPAERSCEALLGVLEGMYEAGRNGAEEAFLTLRAFARGEYGRMAFDRTVPPANLSADLVVFHVPNLELPDKAVMDNETLAAQLLPEQLGALGAFYLIAAAGRAILLADPTRFAMFVAEEAWALLKSPQGKALLESTGREGRRTRAALMLLFQHPADVEDEKLLALLPTRFVYGQGEGAGVKAAEFLGAEPTDMLVAKLTRSEGGIVRKDDEEAPPMPAQCFMRDHRGRIGHVVWRPATGVWAEALETNPKRLAAMRAAARDATPAPAALPVPANGNGHVEPTELADFEVAR